MDWKSFTVFPHFFVYEPRGTLTLKETNNSSVSAIAESSSDTLSVTCFRIWCASYLEKLWKETSKKFVVLALKLRFEWATPKSVPKKWQWWMSLAVLSTSLPHIQQKTVETFSIRIRCCWDILKSLEACVFLKHHKTQSRNVSDNFAIQSSSLRKLCFAIPLAKTKTGSEQKQNAFSCSWQKRLNERCNNLVFWKNN